MRDAGTPARSGSFNPASRAAHGRSRTGRLLEPKTGTLSMTIQAMLRGIAFVAADQVHVQLAHDVAQRPDVDLLHPVGTLQGLAGAVELGAQLVRVDRGAGAGRDATNLAVAAHARRDE